MKIDEAKELIETWVTVEGVGIRTDLLIEALDTLKKALNGEEEDDNEV